MADQVPTQDGGDDDTEDDAFDRATGAIDTTPSAPRPTSSPPPPVPVSGPLAPVHPQVQQPNKHHNARRVVFKLEGQMVARAMLPERSPNAVFDAKSQIFFFAGVNSMWFLATHLLLTICECACD